MNASVCEYSPVQALKGKFDIFHIHWPEQRLSSGSASRAFASCLFLFAAIDLLRLRGCKAVWTVHNLNPHENRHPLLERWFYKGLLARIDGILTLSAGAADSFRRRFAVGKDLPSRTIPHGHYRGAYPSSLISRSRQILGIPSQAQVVLFFGQLRAYKNVSALVNAFRQLDGKDLRLIIAGAPRGEEGTREILAQTSGDSRISLHARHIRDEDVQLFFGSCDLVVLPYRQILNSGTALLALSFNRPVLVPDMGAMRDLQQEIGPLWVRLYSEELSPTHIKDSLDNIIGIEDFCDLRRLDWSVVAEQTRFFFSSLMETSYK